MDIGEIVRRLHWRAWDASAPVPEVSMAELVSVLPVIIESGSAGVVWPRLRERFGVDSAVGMALEAAYASQVQHNARVEREIAQVVGLLHEAGIQPVLIKGLAVARLYPSPLVRPAGDIDLVVRDEEYDAARELLAEERYHLSFHGDPAARRAYAMRSPVERAGGDDEHRPYGDVDLHAASKWYGSRGNARFFEDAEAVTIAGQRVHVPCVEDHLRALCLHFLRHGAVRPIRLCDVALLIEGDDRLRCEHRPYDWDRILRGSARQIEQVAVTLRLAEELLGAAAGARLEGAPEVVRSPEIPDALPQWLVPTVVRAWGRPTPTHRTALPELIADPRGVIGMLRKRWPDPLSATVRVGARFDDGARMPIQLAAFGKQAAMYAGKETLRVLFSASHGDPSPTLRSGSE